jgi:hypothetical protein
VHYHDRHYFSVVVPGHADLVEADTIGSANGIGSQEADEDFPGKDGILDLFLPGAAGKNLLFVEPYLVAKGGKVSSYFMGQFSGVLTPVADEYFTGSVWRF